MSVRTSAAEAAAAVPGSGMGKEAAAESSPHVQRGNKRQKGDGISRTWYNLPAPSCSCHVFLGLVFKKFSRFSVTSNLAAHA